MKTGNAQFISLVLKTQGAIDALEIITKPDDAIEAGRRAHLMAFILGTGRHANQKELAACLGLSKGRVSVMLKKLNRETALFHQKTGRG
jgi:DNA-binding MarR family transcriptional regulator